MRIIILLLVTVFLTLAFDTARADNPNKCFWHGGWGGLSYERREFNVSAPSFMRLRVGAVGSVMATSADHKVASGATDVRCPTSVKVVTSAYEMAPGSGAELESGYRDVYKTGVAGIGVRFRAKDLSGKNVSIPGTDSYNNAGALSHSFVTALRYELVRTGQGVSPGDLKLNFKIRVMVDQWNVANISINGITRVETDGYFDGCAGVKKDISIPMGKVRAGDINNGVTPTQSFELDVFCTGLPAGSRLPVKVYFEGASPGAGRLKLSGGGASGVEISLLSDRQPLPFTKSTALDMKWIASMTRSELYSLPISARYIKIQGASVTPGRADATLNYILEYE